MMTQARPTVADEHISVQTFHSFVEAESFRPAWNDLVVRSGADVYQSFDWCRIWWQHYGQDRQLHLLLYFQGEQLVGVVPAFTETLWLGLARIRVAKLVGADFSLHLCNLSMTSNVIASLLPRVIRYFFGEYRCDLLLLGPLSGSAARIDELIAAGRSEPELVERAETLGQSCNTYIHLPATFAEYLKVIGKQQRGNFNRSLTQFSTAHRVTFDVVSQPDKVMTEFENFRLLHNAQWKAEGKLGHFDDWPYAEKFNRDLVRTLGGQGMVRFYRILADNQVVSSQFSYVFGGVNYWRLPARASRADWDRLSFGRMGLIKMVEASIGEGQRIVEGGRGHYAYKLQLGGCESPLRTVQFVRQGPGVSARVRLFRTSASLLNLTYYKVLFTRLAPRIRAFQRPLLPVWIRTNW